MASLRDNLLVTAGARAAYMDGMMETITLPDGIAGEDKLAEFIVEIVDCYIDGGFDEPFDTYIEESLIIKFGR